MIFNAIIGLIVLVVILGFLFLVALDLRNRTKSHLEKKSSEELSRIQLTLDAGGFAFGIVIYLSSDRLTLLLFSGALPSDIEIVLLMNGILFYGGLLIAALALIDAVWRLSAAKKNGPNLQRNVVSGDLEPTSVTSINPNPGSSDRIKMYKGQELRRHPDGVAIGDKVFKNVLEAERFVNNG